MRENTKKKKKQKGNTKTKGRQEDTEKGTGTGAQKLQTKNRLARKATAARGCDAANPTSSPVKNQTSLQTHSSTRVPSSSSRQETNEAGYEADCKVRSSTRPKNGAWRAAPRPGVPCSLPHTNTGTRINMDMVRTGQWTVRVPGAGARETIGSWSNGCASRILTK